MRNPVIRCMLVSLPLLALSPALAEEEIRVSLDERGVLVFSNTAQEEEASTPVEAPLDEPEAIQPEAAPAEPLDSAGLPERYCREERRQLELELASLRVTQGDWRRIAGAALERLEEERRPAPTDRYDRTDYDADLARMNQRMDLLKDRLDDLAVCFQDLSFAGPSFYLPEVDPVLLRAPASLDDGGKWEYEWRLESTRLLISEGWLDQLRQSLEPAVDRPTMQRLEELEQRGSVSVGTQISELGRLITPYDRDLYRLLVLLDGEILRTRGRREVLTDAARLQGAPPGWVR